MSADVPYVPGRQIQLFGHQIAGCLDCEFQKTRHRVALIDNQFSLCIYQGSHLPVTHVMQRIAETVNKTSPVPLLLPIMDIWYRLRIQFSITIFPAFFRHPPRSPSTSQILRFTKCQAENPACHAEIPAFSSGFSPNYEIRAYACR
ncbi:MAG: hypothetical protein KGL95_02235 [Patescibacteria group bacterium]|nr:hypothetical protein [Patescibacteria group bacterium]